MVFNTEAACSAADLLSPSAADHLLRQETVDAESIFIK